MNTTLERRVIISNPQKVTVKYANGEREELFDNRVTEVIVTDMEE